MSAALSGRDPADLTVDAVLAGELGLDDVRIHPETLRAQARVADGYANPNLGENLRRAAELTVLPDDRVLAIYEALRPGRSSSDDLERIAAELEGLSAPLCAALVREAAAVYARRGV